MMLLYLALCLSLPSSVLALQLHSVGDLHISPCMRERLRNTTMELVGTETDDSLRKAGLDAIYVVHYTQLSLRQIHATEELKKAGLQAKFVTGWDRDVLNDEDLQCFYPSNAKFDELARSRHFAVSWMHTGEVSLSIKHIAAHYDAVARGYQNVLVLEDDFTFTEDFKPELARLLTHQSAWTLPERPFSLLILGSYKDNTRESRTTDPEWRSATEVTHLARRNEASIGYVISLQGAEHVLAHLPFEAPADHVLSNRDFATAPPHRYVHKPWLIEPRAAPGGLGTSSPKAERMFVRTQDLQPCVGSNCPCAISNVSKWVIRGKENHCNSSMEAD